MNSYYIAFFTALVISFILTPIVRKLAIRVGAFDIPKDDRRVHSEPMPYLGGLAIYISTIACLTVFMPLNKTNICIMIGSTIIVLIGLLDDMKDISPKLKLAAQILAAVIAVYGGVRIHFITNPLAATGISYLQNLAIPITIFWIVGITNTINLIDGLDGLASGVATIAAATLLFASALKGYTFIIPQYAIIAGASLGFLPFNFNPAKIFMGDTGALFLGYMLAVTSVLGMMKSVAIVALAIPVLALGLPIFDTAFAIFRRLINKKPIMQADKEHLHHRLLEKGLTQRQTVLILYFISMMLGITAVFIADSEPNTGTVVIGIVTVAVLYSASKIGLLGKKQN